MIDFIRHQIAVKRKELDELRKVLHETLKANSDFCKHPRLATTPYEKSCPDCSYHEDRSF